MRLSLLSLFLLLTPAFSQDPYPRLVGGPCEGCEAVLEFGERALWPVDTLPDFGATEPKLRISGTIYLPDGTTPAEGVVLYIYHTDRNGVYPTKGSERDWGRRHGYIRGWVRTGKDGRYTFFTFRPASYPNGTAPQHIHPIILEPNGRYYWVNEYLFDDDPNLTGSEKRENNARGSRGTITLRSEGDLLVGERDFILGRNVPEY